MRHSNNQLTRINKKYFNNNLMPSKLLNTLKVLVLGIALSFGLSFVYAWSPPTEAPPGGNVSAPINTGNTNQFKSADLRTVSFGTGFIRISEDAVAGYVLTSDDEEGNASWQPSSAGGSGSGAHGKQKFFPPGGTFTVPAGVSTVWVSMSGGGGAGAPNLGSSSGAGGGGGAGACMARDINNLTPGSTISITVGAGGVSYQNSSGTWIGSAGGSSSFGTYVSTRGGEGGKAWIQNGAGYASEGGAGGGFSGGGGVGNCSYGSRGDASITAISGTLQGVTFGGSGGGSMFGPGGGETRDLSSADPGHGYGGGGAGAGRFGGSIMGGGAGADGFVLVEW